MNKNFLPLVISLTFTIFYFICATLYITFKNHKTMTYLDATGISIISFIITFIAVKYLIKK